MAGFHTKKNMAGFHTKIFMKHDDYMTPNSRLGRYKTVYTKR